MEAAECTFAPAISERSRLLVEARERAMLEGDLELTGGLDLTLGEDSEAWQALPPEEQAKRRELRALVRADAMHRVRVGVCMACLCERVGVWGCVGGLGWYIVTSCVYRPLFFS